MAAAPAAPTTPGALAPFTFPSTMLNALTAVATCLDVGDLPTAKSRFADLTGIPKKLHKDITALFAEIEAAPKTAAAASPKTTPSLYRSRMTHLIDLAQKDEAAFLAVLPRGETWQNFFSYLAVYSVMVVDNALGFLSRRSEKHLLPTFLKTYYIAINEFLVTGKTKPLVDAVEFLHQEYKKHQPKKGITILDPKKRHAKHVTNSQFFTLGISFQTALNHSESYRLKFRRLDFKEQEVATLAYVGYAHLPLVSRVMAELYRIYDFMSGELLIHFDLRGYEMLPGHHGELSLFQKKFVRQLKSIYKNAVKKCNECIQETTENKKRYGKLYQPIFIDPIYLEFASSSERSPRVMAFLSEHEEEIREYPNFIRAIHQRMNQHIDYIRSKLNSLLDLQLWLINGQLKEWQAENQSFDQLILSLQERTKTLDAIQSLNLFRANPIVNTHRTYLREKLQAFAQFQSAFNGLFGLFMDNMDVTQRFRAVQALQIPITWEEIEPLTKYRSIRWPNGKVQDIRSILKPFGLKPKREFNFLGQLSHSDAPLIELLRPFLQTDWYNRCMVAIKNLPAGRTICVFATPTQGTHVGIPIVETMADLDEMEVKEDAEVEAIKAPVVVSETSPLIYRIRERLLKKMAEAQKNATGVGVKEALTNAETQLYTFFALAHSFEQLLFNRIAMREQLFHATVSIVETVNLMFEQALQTIDAQTHPVDDPNQLWLTHSIQELMERNPNLMSYLNAEEYRMILDTDRAGFDTRDIALLVQEGRTNTASQRLLIEAFKHQTSTLPIPVGSLVANLCTYCSSALSVMATLLDYIANSKKKASRSAELATLNTEWENLLNGVKEGGRIPSRPPTELQTRAYGNISTITDFVQSLRTPKLLAEADYDSLFDNLLKNKLSRLRTEIEKQSTLNPDELSGHLATVLNLTHLIAADVLYLHLLVLENTGHSVTIPESESLPDLVASYEIDTLPSHLKDFVNTHLRNLARYTETADLKGAHPKTKTAAKSMKRAIASVKRAAQEPAATPAAAAAVEADIKAGFEEVEARVVVETRELAVKYIQRLSELISFVCVPSKA